MNLIILGMHRSGTSALACILTKMGFFAGSDSELLSPAPDNPEGFWERKDVISLNNKLLRRQNCRWDMVSSFSINNIGANLKRDLIERAGNIIAKLDARPPWLLKDPRMCLTLPFWMNLLKNPVCVVLTRNPAFIAESLNRRNSIPCEVGMALWEYYMVSAINNSAAFPRFFVSFEKLVENPNYETEIIYANLLKIGCSKIAIPSKHDIGMCIKPRDGQKTLNGDLAKINFSEEQARLWAHISSNSIPDHMSVSERSIQLIKKYESDILKKMPLRKRTTRALRSALLLLDF